MLEEKWLVLCHTAIGAHRNDAFPRALKNGAGGKMIRFSETVYRSIKIEGFWKPALLNRPI
jgi:hypothetical protein